MNDITLFQLLEFIWHNYTPTDTCNESSVLMSTSDIMNDLHEAMPEARFSKNDIERIMKNARFKFKKIGWLIVSQKEA